MREAQPGGEVPLHVVVAADRHREARGVYLSIGGGGGGRGGRGGGGQRVEPSDSASKGGKAGGRNRWDCDGRSLCVVGLVGCLPRAGRGEERNRIYRRGEREAIRRAAAAAL
jgi:hypothetical protein